MEDKNKYCGIRNTKEVFEIQLTDLELYDRLHILSIEYSVSLESLVDVSIRRLLDDVDFLRNLRSGKFRDK